MLNIKLTPNRERAYSLVLTLFLYVIALKFVAKQSLNVVTAWSVVIATTITFFIGRVLLRKFDSWATPIERRTLVFTALSVSASLAIFSVVGLATGSRLAGICGALLFVALGIFAPARRKGADFDLYLFHFPARKWIFLELTVTYLIAIVMQTLLYMAAAGFFAR